MLHIIKKNKIKKIVKIDYQIIIKGVRFFFTHNLKDFIQKVKAVIERESRIVNYNQSYRLFLKKNKLTHDKIEKEKEISKKMNYQPKISFLMPTYNSPHRFLKMNIESVINQIYQNFELCISDDNSSDHRVRDIIKEYAKKDKRIKYVFRKENGHISLASNSALKIAKGKYIALLDHDDILYPNTLSECIKELNRHPDADFIYTDEDKIDTHEIRFEPHFKPDWSPETLLSGNYITHLAFIKKKLVDQVCGFRIGYEGAQDFDLFLRVTEHTNKIYHIPQILYSWRSVETSTASKNSNTKAEYAYKNGVKCLEDAFKRRGLKAHVEIGEGRGLYQYNIENKNKSLDFFILKNKSKFNNKNLVKEIRKNYPYSKIKISSKRKLGQKLLDFIKTSKSDYLTFLDSQCFIDPNLIESNLGFFKIKPIRIVSNKITNIGHKIYKTGIIITRNQFLDAFQNMTDGGYFNFNYSHMTKNFSATSLLGTTIDTKYFQSKNLSQIKNFNNLKDLGIFLSYFVIKANNRIVYNPNYPIIYKGKYIDDTVLKKNIDISKKIIFPKDYDKNYNPNLTVNDNYFNIKLG